MDKVLLTVITVTLLQGSFTPPSVRSNHPYLLHLPFSHPYPPSLSKTLREGINTAPGNGEQNIIRGSTSSHQSPVTILQLSIYKLNPANKLNPSRTTSHTPDPPSPHSLLCADVDERRGWVCPESPSTQQARPCHTSY